MFEFVWPPYIPFGWINNAILCTRILLLQVKESLSLPKLNKRDMCLQEVIKENSYVYPINFLCMATAEELNFHEYPCFKIYRPFLR